MNVNIIILIPRQRLANYTEPDECTLVPDNWATIEITNTSEGDALHGQNYTLICTVEATIHRKKIQPKVHWYNSDGLVIKTGGRLKVVRANINGTTTTLSLTFSPVLHEDGGVYSCRAQVTVPWMATQPPVKRSSVNMAVTSNILILYTHNYRFYNKIYSYVYTCLNNNLNRT